LEQAAQQDRQRSNQSRSQLTKTTSQHEGRQVSFRDPNHDTEGKPIGIDGLQIPSQYASPAQRIYRYCHRYIRNTAAHREAPTRNLPRPGSFMATLLSGKSRSSNGLSAELPGIGRFRNTNVSSNRRIFRIPWRAGDCCRSKSAGLTDCWKSQTPSGSRAVSQLISVQLAGKHEAIRRIMRTSS
jgi:hypothetical protein